MNDKFLGSDLSLSDTQKCMYFPQSDLLIPENNSMKQFDYNKPQMNLFASGSNVHIITSYQCN